MGSRIYLQETIQPGRTTVLRSTSPRTPFAALFEDDGRTGNLYALDTTLSAQPVLDALRLYDVALGSDHLDSSTLQIAWSDDGFKAVAVINRRPHAVFDFEAHRGYCRTNSPAPDAAWTSHSHEWDDAAISLFC